MTIFCLPAPVPDIECNGGSLKINGVHQNRTPMSGCRPKWALPEFGIIVKANAFGATARGQYDLYHSVDPEDQPYFSVPVAIGDNWIAEVLYSDMESLRYDYDTEEPESDLGEFAEHLSMKYNITDWCLDQSKAVNGGTHLIIHDYASDGVERSGWEEASGCECTACFRARDEE